MPPVLPAPLSLPLPLLQAPRSNDPRRAAPAHPVAMTPATAVAVASEAPAPAPVIAGLAASSTGTGTAAAGAEVAAESGGGGAERRSRFRRICVYCGSAKGKKPSYQDAAIQLGNQLVRTPPIPCRA